MAHGVIPQAAVVTLHNQNTDQAGYATSSDNYETSYSGNDSQGADDFLVPAGNSWTVTEVIVSGFYGNSAGGVAKSETVTFYRSKNSKPTSTVTVQRVKGAANHGSFTIKLKSPVTLSGGTSLPIRYWVSVAANMGASITDTWYWETGVQVYGLPAVWRGPYYGTGNPCSNWGPLQAYCFAGEVTGPDLMYELKGTEVL